MGRVRKYKKFKACDPFSKKGRAEVDTIHDEPPDIHDEKARKVAHRRDNFWDDEEKRELVLSRQAIKFTVEENTKAKKAEKKLEKRVDESMKEFKQRVRQETRMTLKDELRALSASRQKKKLKLKERTLKKKIKNNARGNAGDDIEDEDSEFRTSEEGKIRASDLDGSSTFPVAEPVIFGATLNAMPDLNKWKVALTKKMTKKSTLALDEEETTSNSKGRNHSMNILSSDYINPNEIQSLKRKKVSITDLMNADDSISGVTYASDFIQEKEENSKNNIIKRVKVVKSGHIGVYQTSTPASLEQLRDQSRLAYAKLKLSRRT